MPDGWAPFAEHINGVSKYTPGGQNKVGICSHTAAGFYTTLRNRDFWNNAGYSVHFAIARDGRICQLVNIFDRAWGQGRLGPVVSWAPFNAMGRRNPNEYLISIEHEDWVLENGVAKPVPGPVWTSAQFDASIKVQDWCIEEFQRVRNHDLLTFDKESICGHYMFDGVNRANCPGQPWANDYRDSIYQTLVNDGVAHPPIGAEGNGGEFDTMNAWNSYATKGMFANIGSGPVKLEPGVKQNIWARFDFDLPPTAKKIRVELALLKGYAVIMSEREGKIDQCRVGWGVPIGQSSYGWFDVDLDNEGWFNIGALDEKNPVEIVFMHCIGWW